ncbi:hypothetical protein PIB30_013801 [Stylosanthes scabra]|uniref:Uncharacterized protein n=1 Tax=Stylosanthes scabra TaxID=79078 RepID=A0ABU6R6M6_9FABA|nr:hypothetical protein [Stylosanthes scabra]
MAKNNNSGKTLAIAMLMILVIICSAIDEAWTRSHYIASNSLEFCAGLCLRRNKNKTKMKKICIKECIIRKCSQLYSTDKKKQFQCTNRLVAKYDKNIFWGIEV